MDYQASAMWRLNAPAALSLCLTSTEAMKELMAGYMTKANLTPQSLLSGSLDHTFTGSLSSIRSSGF